MKIIGYANEILLNCVGMEKTSKERAAFADRLRQTMLDNGHKAERGAAHKVSAKALATAIGISVETARRYIGGGAMPRVEKMTKLAAWLGVNVPWLRDGTPPKHGSTTNYEWIDVMESLTDEQRETVMRVIMSYKKRA